MLSIAYLFKNSCLKHGRCLVIPQRTSQPTDQNTGNTFSTNCSKGSPL
jgi:hypothetical protein